MNKKIVFSPVGGTDPISLSNYHDGSMLHICRVYQPDTIYLYLSKEILATHEKDDRYRYTLNRLCELQERAPMDIQLIKRPELEDVQEFDFFYTEFQGILQDIVNSLDSTDELLINISSGTPAMKSGLLVLTTMVTYPCRIIQVVTPTRSMNEHTHKGYDNETVWELDEDNQEDFINRCKEVRCPTLARIKKEEIIKQQILDYDYESASAIAKSLRSEHYVGSYMRLIEMGRFRRLLDMEAVDKIIKETKYNCFPIKKDKDRECFEYALSLQIKLKRKQYADFIVGITPIIMELFIRVLKEQAKINLRNYTINDYQKWNVRKLMGTEYAEKMAAKIPAFDYSHFVNSHALIILIEEYCDKEVADICRNLRHVEEKIRNKTAHQIVALTPKKIEEETDFRPEYIMRDIRRLFQYTDIPVKEKQWDSYDFLNEEILRRME